MEYTLAVYMDNKGTFSEHRQRALDEYREHVLTCSCGPEAYWLREEEFELQAGDFEEDGFMIKMVEDEVKIKWETPCPWVGCTWMLYYCRMIEKPLWEEPYDIAKRRMRR